MPKLPHHPGIGRSSADRSHVANSLQPFRQDSLTSSCGSMTDFSAPRSSSSPSRLVHDVKLPSIQSLIQDTSRENLDGLSNQRSGPFTIPASPSGYQPPVSNTISSKPRGPPSLSVRTQTASTAWDHKFSPNRPTGINGQNQSPKFSPHTQHMNSLEKSLSDLRYQRNSESSPNSYHPSVVLGASQSQPMLHPAKLPLPPLEKPLQQYHQHHISAKTSTIMADQQAQPYVCQQCNKVFSRPSSLKIHGHSHTGEKPFRCPHVDCGKAFSVRSNMKRHEKGCHEA